MLRGPEASTAGYRRRRARGGTGPGATGSLRSPPCGQLVAQDRRSGRDGARSVWPGRRFVEARLWAVLAALGEGSGNDHGSPNKRTV